MMHRIRLALGACLLCAVAALSACGGDGVATVTPVDGRVSIPVAGLNDGRARFFTLADNGKTIRFFLIQSGDGVVRAAFDACDVCFPERKGYKQEGEYMVCVNCGQKFHVSRINDVKGGCNPAPLMRGREGDAIVIALSDIQAGARYF